MHGVQYLCQTHHTVSSGVLSGGQFATARAWRAISSIRPQMHDVIDMNPVLCERGEQQLIIRGLGRIQTVVRAINAREFLTWFALAALLVVMSGLLIRQTIRKGS